MIEKNQQAPWFRLQNQGKQWTEVSEFLGHKVFLFFLPGVETLDDQLHVMNYAREIAWFQRLGVIIIGICGSDADTLYRFSNQYRIPFLLVEDPDHAVRDAYGVWNEKITFGTSRWITARTSLLIDEDGRIMRVWKRAKIERNAYDVLDYLQHLHDKAEWRKLSRRTKERLRREGKAGVGTTESDMQKAPRYIKLR